MSETVALLAMSSAFVEEHAAHRQKPFLVSTDKRGVKMCFRMVCSWEEEC